MITSRLTRLIRVPDLHTFRRILSIVWEAHAGAGPEPPLVIVPTQGAARQLRRTLERAGSSLCEQARANLVTRDQFYERLYARLPSPPRRLTPFEREAIAQAAAAEASAGAGLSSPTAESSTEHASSGHARGVPFQLRPGLVAEILRFYDQLRRQSQQVRRFAELIEEAVGAASPVDLGVERILQQTRFLASTFRAYERRVFEAHACDEHALRDHLITESIHPPPRHIIVTIQDWIADPDGLFAADFDLLARLPGVEAIDIVCTEALLGSGFHERLHNWWPGIDEASGADIAGRLPEIRPVLLTPAGAEPDRPWFTLRDREEELLSIAGQVQAHNSAALDRQAVVYKRPLPYLYLAPETFGAAAIPYQTSDALPLAAEPTAAALDLILDVVETNFSRDSLVALLRSPHYGFETKTGALTREQVSALDRGLSDARYLGELPRLEDLASRWTVAEALPALELGLEAARELAPLLEPAPASIQIRRVLAFISRHARALEAGDPFERREQRARAAVAAVLGALALAREAHHDEMWTISDLSAAVRRWIQEETFVPASSEGGIHLIDDQASRFGEFERLSLVGLVESDWPERPHRNIFYSPSLLKSLGWPTEKDRRAAADARFLDLLASASRRGEGLHHHPRRRGAGHAIEPARRDPQGSTIDSAYAR